MSHSWVASQIAALVFITLDFVVVMALLVLTLCTQTATSLDTTRSVSGVAVVALIAQIVCLAVVLGVFYIWIGILEAVVPQFTTPTLATTTTVTTAPLINATTIASTTLSYTTAPITTPELILRQVGQFVAFALWTSPGSLLVIRSREGGMLTQDVFWNVVSLLTQTLNLVMAVFVSLGSKAHLYAPAAVAVSFGCIYALDLILLFVLTFKQKAREESWDRSNDYLYNTPR